MRESMIILVIVGVFISGLPFHAVAQEKKAREEKTLDGKTIFLEKKCGGCHSVEGANIVKKTSGSPSKTGPPDLSRVGTKHDAGFIAKYLQKKESVNGKRHLIKFSGNDEELDTLAKWLESLKADSTKNTKK